MVIKNTLQLLIMDVAALVFRGLKCGLNKLNLHLADKKIEVAANKFGQSKQKFNKAVKETLGHLAGIGSGAFRCIPIIATVYYGTKWEKAYFRKMEE